jgi:hypothetical protein
MIHRFAVAALLAAVLAPATSAQQEPWVAVASDGAGL